MKTKIAFLILTSSILTQSCSNNNPNLDGERLYKENCLNCHQEQGQGVGKLIPPLTDTKYLIQYRNQLPCIIKNGMQGEIKINGILYNEKMPISNKMTEADMVNLLNYIGKNFGNNLETFTMKEVNENLENCP